MPLQYVCVVVLLIPECGGFGNGVCGYMHVCEYM